MTRLVDALPPVTEAQRSAIEAAPRTIAAHQELAAEIGAMGCLEVGGAGSKVALPATMAVAAWNVERCLFPRESADHLKPYAPDLVLLSEMDHGMARTGQVNTAAEMARHLRMHYAYGVEFYEIGLGGPEERAFCRDDFNRSGWHGNAILSSAPFLNLILIRLDDKGYWFNEDGPNSGNHDQSRIGGRMAIAALIDTENGPICAVSTHLESNADAPYREAQFSNLLDAVDAFAPDVPVIIGGDLNTGNHLPPDFDWRQETLFDMARARDYGWDLTPEGITTRASLITPHQTRRMKLDWFCSRGLSGHPRALVPSLDPDGKPLSDHECIVCEVTRS